MGIEAMAGLSAQQAELSDSGQEKDEAAWVPLLQGKAAAVGLRRSPMLGSPTALAAVIAPFLCSYSKV